MVDVRIQEPKVDEPKMRIHLVDQYGRGLVPMDFSINDVSVPCKAIELNLTANEPGEIVLHISLYRIGIVLDVSEQEKE